MNAFSSDRRSGEAAFTMIEVAISIAIVGFALVAIIGVLPTGFDVQRRNRENTIINQEGSLWLEALRSGAWGLEYLTNHVDAISIPAVPVNGFRTPRVFGTTNGFRNGRDIVGLLTQPAIVDGRRIYERPVTTFVRAITGSAGEKTSKNDFAFSYRLVVGLRPFSALAPAQTNFTVSGLDALDQFNRSNLWARALALQATTYELSLAIEWPVYVMNNQARVGNNRKLFRTLVSSSLAGTNDSRLGELHWLQPLGAPEPAMTAALLTNPRSSEHQFAQFALPVERPGVRGGFVHRNAELRFGTAVSQRVGRCVPNRSSTFLPRRSTAFRSLARAFTLLEVMVAVGIMGIIVTALYTVFNATQRAMRANANQTDVMEGGRFTMAMLVTDLRSLTAAGVSPETNFISTLSPGITIPILSALNNDLFARYYVTGKPNDWSGYLPVIQALNVRNERRTNVLEELFIYSRTGARSSGIAYRVVNARGGVGTLARYAYEHTNRFMLPGTLSTACLLQPAVNFAPVLDGVVHFRVQAYDPLGYPMTWMNSDRYVNATTNAQSSHGYQLGVDLVLERDPRLATGTLAMFRSNSLPSAIELEIGILDPESLAQFRALPAASAFAERFLSNRAAQVQLFRQRIPIWQASPLQAAQSVRP